jgi:hypothetical protein
VPVAAIATSASPPDISAILTSLGVFSLAIAAVVGGIYKGIKEVKKGGVDTDRSLAGGLIMDRGTLVLLVDSNERLTNSNREILEQMRSIDRHVERLVETMQDSRETVRSQIEEQHRLRAAVVDLVEMMRRFRA